jgi:aspartate aminotransferase
MRISQRTLSIAVSPIRKLTPYAKEAVAKGKKIYHLNIGQPDLPTPETFMKEIETFKDKTVVYGPSQGNPDLLKAIQKYYQGWQMNYALDNIYITNGGSEALSFRRDGLMRSRRRDSGL